MLPLDNTNFLPPFVAPKALEAASVSTSTIAVTVVPNQPSRAHYFTVNFKGGAAGTLCRLNAGAEPLTCTFGSLTIGQEYTFEGKACVTRGKEATCSPPKEVKGYTTPDGKLLFFLQTKYTSYLIYANVKLPPLEQSQGALK